MIKLPPDYKAKWIEALRSGRYAQGKNYLRVKDTYCCLGVLCDITGTEWKPMDGSDCYGSKGWTGIPNPYECYPKEIIPAMQQDVKDESLQWLLSRMNDDGKSFNEIADWIEENL